MISLCFFFVFFTGLQINLLLLSTEWRMHALSWCRLPPCWKPTHTRFLLAITSSMAPGASSPGPLTSSWPLMKPRYFILFDSSVYQHRFALDTVSSVLEDKCWWNGFLHLAGCSTVLPVHQLSFLSLFFFFDVWTDPDVYRWCNRWVEMRQCDITSSALGWI